MPRRKQEKYVELIPCSDRGRKRAAYHGQRWLLRKETNDPYRGATPGTWLACMSCDGKALLWVKKSNDEDFRVRVL